MTKFVYIYSNNGVPYYVGKGNRKRIFMKHGVLVPSSDNIQFFEFDSEQEAWDTEIQLIAFFGRQCDGGTLMNVSTGGAGGTTGVQFSDEHKAKMSLAAKKHIRENGHPQQGRVGALSHNSFTYLVTHPCGKTEVIVGITQFCREHSLNASAMVAVSKGRRTHHKGYKCVST